MPGREAQSVKPSISFDITTRVAVGSRLTIFLHLFREGISILTRPIDTIGERDAAQVIAKCRESLERRGFARFEDEGFAFAPVRRYAAGAK